MRGGGGAAGRGWGGGQGGNIKTGTVKKKQSWLSSIEYGGNGARTPPPTNWVILFCLSHALNQHCYLHALALSWGMVEIPGQNTKGTHRGSVRALNAEEYFLSRCLPPNIQNPSLFLRWHSGSSIQLRQAKHCAERENLSQRRRLTQAKVDNRDSGKVS